MPIVTISRGTMSGGHALAECLAAKLNVPSVASEIITEAASKVGSSEEVLTKKLEKSPGVWDRMTSERRVYVVAMQAALAEHAASGNLVYHGRAGHMLLRGVPAVLRVRLIAPMDMRIRAVVDKHKMGRREAEEYIHQVDEDRVRWAKFIYGVDLREPALYDMVLSLETMSIATACTVVAEALRQPEYAITGEVKKKLADFVLASKVRLALATHAASRHLELDVQADGGNVTITGEAPQPAMLTHVSTMLEQELTAVARGVEGVEKVDLKVRPFDAYH
ncbi:MAG: cytidylate kinase family protein [Acidobacteriota bacterium]